MCTTWPRFGGVFSFASSLTWTFLTTVCSLKDQSVAPMNQVTPARPRASFQRKEGVSGNDLPLSRPLGHQ